MLPGVMLAQVQGSGAVELTDQEVVATLKRFVRQANMISDFDGLWIDQQLLELEGHMAAPQEE